MVGAVALLLAAPGEDAGPIPAALRQGAGDAGGRTVFCPEGPGPGGLFRLPAAGSVRAGALRRRWGGLFDGLAESPADVGVIALDGFERTEPVALRQALAELLPGLLPSGPAPLRLVSYLRPHAERVRRAYVQAVAAGHLPGPPEAHYARTAALHRLAPGCLAWQAAFGAAFVPRPLLADRLAGGTVLADFLALLPGPRPDPAPAPAPAPAPGPARPVAAVAPDDMAAAADLALLLAVHRAFRRGGPSAPGPELAEARRRVAARLARHLGPPDPVHPPFALPRGLVERIAADCAGDAAALDAAFFPDGAMQGALAAAVAAAPEAASLQLSDHFDAEARGLVDLWVRLADDLLLRAPADWPAHLDALAAAAVAPAARATKTSRRRKEDRPGKDRPGKDRPGKDRPRRDRPRREAAEPAGPAADAPSASPVSASPVSASLLSSGASASEAPAARQGRGRRRRLP